MSIYVQTQMRSCDVQYLVYMRSCVVLVVVVVVVVVPMVLRPVLLLPLLLLLLLLLLGRVMGVVRGCKNKRNGEENEAKVNDAFKVEHLLRQQIINELARL
jgi:hypothetical protein